MFLTSLFRAATPENPRFPLNDPAAWDALGAQPSLSGVRVNSQTALQYSPFFRAVDQISSDFAKLPLIVYKANGKGKSIAPEHPAYHILRWQPNNEQIAFDWKAQMAAISLVHGNSYSYIFRSSAGAPLEILPLDSAKTFPVRENGRLMYVTEIGTEKRKLAKEDVLHFHGLSYDGITGLSIIECAREALGLGMGAQRYGAIFFKNSARGTVVLTHPLKLNDQVKNTLREGWERMQAGLDNAHKTAVLDSGLDIKQFSADAEKAQLLETLKQNGIDIANFFKIPPHKLGNRDAASYASLEQENQAYMSDCIGPRLTHAEEQLRAKMLSEEEKATESHIVLFDRKQLCLTNQASRASYFRTALGGRPWMTQNEVRDEEGLNPDEGENANDILDPLNMGQGGIDNEPADPAQDNKKPRKGEAYRKPLMDAVARMVRRVATHGGRFERAIRDGAKFCAWLEMVQEYHLGAFEETIDPLAGLGAGDAALSRIVGEFSTLADTCKPADLPARARELMAAIEKVLPGEIADTVFASEMPERKAA